MFAITICGYEWEFELTVSGFRYTENAYEWGFVLISSYFNNFVFMSTDMGVFVKFCCTILHIHHSGLLEVLFL